MKTTQKSVVKAGSRGLLSREEFQKLTSVPPEIEWFANLDNERARRTSNWRRRVWIRSRANAIKRGEVHSSTP